MKEKEKRPVCVCEQCRQTGLGGVDSVGRMKALLKREGDGPVTRHKGTTYRVIPPNSLRVTRHFIPWSEIAL